MSSKKKSQSIKFIGRVSKVHIFEDVEMDVHRIEILIVGQNHFQTYRAAYQITNQALACCKGSIKSLLPMGVCEEGAYVQVLEDGTVHPYIPLQTPLENTYPIAGAKDVQFDQPPIYKDTPAPKPEKKKRRSATTKAPDVSKFPTRLIRKPNAQQEKKKGASS